MRAATTTLASRAASAGETGQTPASTPCVRAWAHGLVVYIGEREHAARLPDGPLHKSIPAAYAALHRGLTGVCGGTTRCTLRFTEDGLEILQASRRRARHVFKFLPYSSVVGFRGHRTPGAGSRLAPHMAVQCVLTREGPVLRCHYIGLENTDAVRFMWTMAWNRARHQRRAYAPEPHDGPRHAHAEHTKHAPTPTAPTDCGAVAMASQPGADAGAGGATLGTGPTRCPHAAHPPPPPQRRHELRRPRQQHTSPPTPAPAPSNSADAGRRLPRWCTALPSTPVDYSTVGHGRGLSLPRVAAADAGGTRAADGLRLRAAAPRHAHQPSPKRGDLAAHGTQRLANTHGLAEKLAPGMLTF